MSKDFGDGLPLILGEIYGRRVWKEYGKGLRSPAQMDFCWGRGVNVSQCEENDWFRSKWLSKLFAGRWIPEGAMYSHSSIINSDVSAVWHMIVTDESLLPSASEIIKLDVEEFTMMSADGWKLNVKSWDVVGWTHITDPKEREEFLATNDNPPDPPSHLDLCTCGFYAYFDGEANIFANQDTNVVGIIKGSGETLIGERGFRSKKAEIVALAPYSHPGYYKMSRSSRKRLIATLKRDYPDVAVYKTERQMNRKHRASTMKEFASV